MDFFFSIAPDKVWTNPRYAIKHDCSEWTATFGWDRDTIHPIINQCIIKMIRILTLWQTLNKVVCVCVCVMRVCREKVQDIQELRRAVKKEAAELEKQLNELAHHYDNSLKMVTHSLTPTCLMPIWWENSPNRKAASKKLNAISTN